MSRKPLPPLPKRKPPVNESPQKLKSSGKQSKPGLKRPEAEDIKTLLLHLLKTQDNPASELDKLPKEELAETESWLDWGLGLVKQYGPMLLEVAPMLLAAL